MRSIRQFVSLHRHPAKTHQCRQGDNFELHVSLSVLIDLPTISGPLEASLAVLF